MKTPVGTGNIHTQEELDVNLGNQADKLGSYVLASARLDADAIRGELARANPWQYDWAPTSPQELHWAKSTNDILAPFAHEGISRRAKRAKYGELQALRSAALRDNTAIAEADSVDNFCSGGAMDAIEKYLVGLHLIAALQQDPDTRFSKAQMEDFLTIARSEVYNCQTEDEFMDLAYAAQESHKGRFKFWYEMLRDLEQKYQYLKDVS